MNDTEKLKAALAGLPQAQDAGELVRLADSVDQGIRDTEFNFPANVITITDVHPALMGPKEITMLREEGERMMLQVAFLNVGQNPPCSFIQVAYDHGWRYRIDKGFHKVTA